MEPIFKTNKKSSDKSQSLKKMFNDFPAFKATGGEIIFVSDDFFEVHLKFNLNEKTMNYHGTGFGGAIYSSLDPVFPLQFAHILGVENFEIWDLSATIDYLKPINKDVYAKFILTDEILINLKKDIELKKRHVVKLPVQYEDLQGNIYAKATKTVYIADKEYFKNKKKK